MNRTKWTLESLNDEEDEETGALPQMKEISRAALAAPDFAAPAFLAEYSQFRTLRDVQQLVGQWERRLETELSDTVNSNFSEFVAAVAATENGEVPLRSVQADLRRFSGQAQRLADALAAAEARIGDELATHRALSVEEARARKLLHLFDLLGELEATVPEIDASNGPGLVVLAKSYVALARIARDMPTAKALSVLKLSIDSVYRELKLKLEGALSHDDNAGCRLELLQAREFVMASVI